MSRKAIAWTLLVVGFIAITLGYIAAGNYMLGIAIGLFFAHVFD